MDVPVMLQGNSPLRLFQGAIAAPRSRLTTTVRAVGMAVILTGPEMAQEGFSFLDWGNLTAKLVNNEATRAFIRMLPVTIAMREHLRQERPRSSSAAALCAAADAYFEGRAGAMERGLLRDLISLIRASSSSDK